MGTVMIEMRTYTVANADALRHYTTLFWPRHIQSLGKYGIIVHGVWTDTTAPEHRVIAMVGYPPGGDAQRIIESYQRSRDYIEDHANFDLTLITSVHVATLEPIPGFDTLT
jgi:hypothetical protein